MELATGMALPRVPTDTPYNKPYANGTETAVGIPDIRHINSENELKEAELSGAQVTISDEQLIRAIERAIKAIQGPYTRLEFSVHEPTKQIMVKVLDRETGELIREVPPEKNLDFVAKLWEMAGILVDVRR